MPKFFFTSLIINITFLVSILFVIVSFPPTTFSKIALLGTCLATVAFSWGNIGIYRHVKNLQLNIPREDKLTETDIDLRKVYRDKLKKGVVVGLIVILVIGIRIFVPES